METRKKAAGNNTVPGINSLQLVVFCLSTYFPSFVLQCHSTCEGKGLLTAGDAVLVPIAEAPKSSSKLAKKKKTKKIGATRILRFCNSAHVEIGSLPRSKI